MIIKSILRPLIHHIKLSRHQNIWRKLNRHNYTTANNIFPIEKVSVGEKTYGSLHVNTYGNSNEKLIIGSFCSIAGDVKFILGGNHYYKSLSTYPFKKYICGVSENTITKGPIIIQDDVWIGENCLILSGVKIGKGAVIGAGSIVTKDVPPYAIYAGGKILKYRFPEDIIKQLIKIDFSNLTEKIIKENIEILYTDLETYIKENNFIKQLLI